MGQSKKFSEKSQLSCPTSLRAFLVIFLYGQIHKNSPVLIDTYDSSSFRSTEFLFRFLTPTG
jgi:hypothetical protein